MPKNGYSKVFFLREMQLNLFKMKWGKIMLKKQVVIARNIFFPHCSSQ